MAQKTNLNVGPYYDDFDKFNNFYKVLFRPGFPIQARELTTLQSVLQNQIESFGRNSFSEGQKVIPGNFALNNQYFSVKINSSHLGINLSSYVDQLVGKKIKGQTSGIVAKVDKYLNISESEGITNLTLFVQYTESGTDNETVFFTNGEVLTTEESFTYSNVVVNAGESIATLVSDNACNIGSKFSIEEGVYFIRGTFVDVAADNIVLDAYTNTPSYRVGLSIDEELVNAKDDPSLYDNAKGFSNFSAPGADRLKITTKLTKKSLDDFNDTSFIELVKIINGVENILPSPAATKLDDKLAKRTYEESGHYSVKEYQIEIKETLDNEIGNQGIYTEGETTASGNTPSDDLMSVKFSPGISYVRGYRIENEETIIIDTEKSRDTDTVDSGLIPLDFGTLVKVNNVTGTPLIGIGNQNTVSLLDRRLNNDGVGTATTIGDARVYSFNLDGNSYEDDASSWNLYLYDVNVYTDLTINTNITLNDTSYIRGKTSNASGYLLNDVTNGTALTLTQVSGSFVVGEQIIINEVEENSRTITAVTKHSQQDVKAIYQADPMGGDAAFDFTADTILIDQKFKQLGNFDATISTGGNVTSSLQDGFLGAKVGSIIKYNKSDEVVPTFNRVTAVGAGSTTLTVEAITNQPAEVCDGALPATEFVGPISLAVGEIKSGGGLYAELPSENISAVDLKDSQLSITVQLNNITVDAVGDGSLTAPTGISSALYKSYSAEKYSFFNEADGVVSTDPDLTLTGGGSGANFDGLSFVSGQATVNASLLKQGITSKKKIYTRSAQRDVILSKTSININGLTQNNFYGLRVQDKEISLNLPDVAKILAVYESLGAANPTLDVIQVSAAAALNTNAIVGEKVKGQTSGAIAQVVQIDSASNAQVVLLNNKSFDVGELVTFDESEVDSIVVSFTKGNYQDITQKYTLDKGGRSEYYDYSRIVRKDDSYIPSHRLKIVFDHYDVLASDTGDVYTVNSYDAERFKEDIPDINGELRASDTLDFRPRVSEFTVTNASPFAPVSRNFATGPNPTLVVTPKEDSILGYEYYLPRIDRIVLQKDGIFSVIKGVSSLNPVEPEIVNKEDLMLLATIELPAYLYDINDVSITFKDNRRYTMRDIGDIDKRVSTLENLTTLSLLEVDTKTLQVKDANGFDKFKSGFFVDAFNDGSKIDLQESKIKCQIDVQNEQLEAFTEITSFAPKIATIDASLDTSVDNLPPSVFPDKNIIKTGNSILLNYTEVETEIKNLLATTTENINPFNILNYNGTIILTPSVDNFTEVKVTQTKTVNQSGAQTKTWTKTKVLDTVDAVYMRSRNVKFEANNLKPFTQHYAFFDGSNQIDIIPKLLQITMTSGTFVPGATVKATNYDGEEIFRGRIAPPNHKSGPLETTTTVSGSSLTNSQDVIDVNTYKTYSINPYDTTKSTNIPENYSANSEILNIDIDILAASAIDEFGGYIKSGFTTIEMIGQDTSASAIVNDIKLVSDISGSIIGSFFLRKPKYVYTFTKKKKLSKKQIKKGFTKDSETNTVTVPDITLLGNTKKKYKKNNLQEVVTNKDKLFTTGTKTFKLTTSKTNAIDGPGKPSIGNAEALYTSTGVIELVKQTTVKMKKHLDPLAQTFFTGEDNITCTSVDVWFKTKPGTQTGISTGITDNIIESDGEPTVTLQLVEVTDDAKPSQNLVISDSQVILQASEVSVSPDASEVTNFKFKTPVPLKAGTEYAIVLLSPSSNDYEVWISQTGNADVSPNSLPESESIVSAKQYTGGALFRSQNGSLWTENQNEDMKFRINKAEFVTTPGTVYFYNNLSNTSPEYQLEENSILTLPRKISVGFGVTDVLNGDLTIGTKVSHGTVSTGLTNPSGIIENVGGGITDTGTINDFITITNTGIGYSAGEFTNVDLYSIQASGTGAQATVYVSAVGIVTGVTITTAGSGYVVGDLLGITTSQVQKGKGAQITVDEIGGIDTLYLTNVQGEDFTTTDPLCYFNTPTTVVSLASTTITSSTDSTDTRFDGNTIRVAQINHGMHGLGHVVSLTGIQPDSIPTTLDVAINTTDTTVAVANTAIFTTFENSTATSGYLKIDNEIMRYTSIGSGQLTVTRGVNPTSHAANSKVYKYELNGISLTRINSDEGNEVTHSGNGNTGAAGIISNDTGIDEYFLKINRSATTSFLGGTLGAITSGTSMRSFTDENAVGGKNVKATRNLQFNAIKTNIVIDGISDKVSANSQIRTVSGRSADGTETLFADQGYQSIDNNALTPLSSVRTIASRPNETTDTILSTLPQSRSFTYAVTLDNSGDKNLSPFIDYSSATVELHRNRLNKPIADYVLDPRVNLVAGDPHAYLYVTQKVDLEQPATSLKVLVDAYRHSSADFRVLYQLFKVESSNNIETYELFPGYDNLKDTNADGFGDLVVDVTKNNGKADAFLPASVDGEFYEYQFTADDLDKFNGFRIKIVASGTNEAYPPIFKNLKVIALA